MADRVQIISWHFLMATLLTLSLGNNWQIAFVRDETHCSHLGLDHHRSLKKKFTHLSDAIAKKIHTSQTRNPHFPRDAMDVDHGLWSSGVRPPLSFTLVTIIFIAFLVLSGGWWSSCKSAVRWLTHPNKSLDRSWPVCGQRINNATRENTHVAVSSCASVANLLMVIYLPSELSRHMQINGLKLCGHTKHWMGLIISHDWSITICCH